jgi:Mg-chelatase subunit ChlD
MKITIKNSSDFRPVSGDFSTTSLVELTPNHKLGRIPSNVVLLLDASSSMGGSKWNMVKTAVSELLDTLKDDDRVGVVLFDSSAKEIFPLASLSANRETMKAAIQKLESPQGVTNLEQGLRTAYGSFDARGAGDKIKRVNHVILLTDGFPTDNQGYRIEKTHRYEEIVKKHEGITLTGIGIGSAEDYDSSFISHLSELGKGSYYHAGDLAKFKEGLRAEVEKLQSSVVGDLILKFSNVSSKIMRIAKIAPEIVIYDVAGNQKQFELKTGSMQKDMTAFLITVSSQANGEAGIEVPLFHLEALYDGNTSEKVIATIKTSEKEMDYMQLDPDVLRGSQVLQVHVNGEQIQKSIQSGDKEKATRLIDNTTRIASNLGQDKVTRILTRLAADIKSGKSVNEHLANIQDESKKTKLIINK